MISHTTMDNALNSINNMKTSITRELTATSLHSFNRRQRLSSQRLHRIYNTNSSSGSVVSSTQPGLLFTAGDVGAWDEAGVGHPIVRYYLGDNEQRWFMWYSGRSTSCRDMDAFFPSSGSMGLAVSSDGLTWSRGSTKVKGERGEAKELDIGCVLQPNEDWWWHDTLHLHVSDVQILSSGNVGSGGAGVYWGFYSGGSFEEVELPQNIQDITGTTSNSMEGIKLRPGLAMSQDGRNWARIEADHHTGALFDVGEDGEWDSLFIGSPQVVAAGPRDLRMYYYSFDQSLGRYIIGVAVSPDGFKWTKKGPMFTGGFNEDDFDVLGATNRCVVRDIDSKNYFMFYEAVAADGKRSIGLAVSKDGISNWQRYSKPLLTAADLESGAWDNGSVGTPWGVSMAQGRWRLYYAGRSSDTTGAWQGIGVALSDKDSQLFFGAPVSFTRRVNTD